MVMFPPCLCCSSTGSTGSTGTAPLASGCYCDYVESDPSGPTCTASVIDIPTDYCAAYDQINLAGCLCTGADFGGVDFFDCGDISYLYPSLTGTAGCRCVAIRTVCERYQRVADLNMEAYPDCCSATVWFQQQRDSVYEFDETQCQWSLLGTFTQDIDLYPCDGPAAGCEERAPCPEDYKCTAPECPAAITGCVCNEFP